MELENHVKELVEEANVNLDTANQLVEELKNILGIIEQQ